jgi:hypothetical protein
VLCHASLAAAPSKVFPAAAEANVVIHSAAIASYLLDACGWPLEENSFG